MDCLAASMPNKHRKDKAMEIGKYEIRRVGWVCQTCGIKYKDNPKHKKGCCMSFTLGSAGVAIIPKDKLKKVLNLLTSE